MGYFFQFPRMKYTVSDNLLESEEELNEFEEYFDYIMANSNFIMSTNWREAESLYLQFAAVATQ